MQIHIDFISSKSENIIHIAGRLSSNAVAQLRKACDQVKDPMVIDVSELLYADEEGINAIRAIADRGSKIRGASPFVQLLLDNASWKKTGVGGLKANFNGFEKWNTLKWYAN